MKRRNFIKASTFASTAMLAPAFLNADLGLPIQQNRAGKILIVLQLSGGNDGLNTIVPYKNDVYYQNRRKIAIPENKVLKVSDELGFHPALKPLQALFDEGLFTIINNVGYPNSVRSHFRSLDIWLTGSNAEEHWKTGWLGRYLDSNCQDCHSPYYAIGIGDNLSLALKGEYRTGFAMRNPRKLKQATNNQFLKNVGAIVEDQATNANLQYLYKTMVSTQTSANYLYQQSKVHKSKAEYPKTSFGKSLKQIAELITADTNTQIYYAGMGGFDTHANQEYAHNRLLKDYAESVTALIKDLKFNGLLKDTLILTFSEFGRRVKQNGSNGTDHGTANNLFLFGGSLRKPGIYNNGPNLQNLINGDLVYEIDFRRIYATILKNWLNADPHQVLGRNFKVLPLF